MNQGMVTFMRKKVYSAFACMLAAILVCINAFCYYDAIDTTRKVSMTIEYQYGGEPVQWTNVEIYKVAEVTSDVEYIPIGMFADYPFDFDMRKNNGKGPVDAFASYVSLHHEEIDPVYRGGANQDGKVSFADQSTGLYLVISNDCTIGYYTYKAEPFLICLPTAELSFTTSGADGSDKNHWIWIYDGVTAKPKIELFGDVVVTDPPTTDPPTTVPPTTTSPVTNPPKTAPPGTVPPTTTSPVTVPPTTASPVTVPPVTEPPVTVSPTTTPRRKMHSSSGNYTSLSVVKQWNDQGNEDKRPASVTVYLIRDNEVYESVKLSKSNNWKYTWMALSDTYTWQIIEKDVPDGYVVSQSKTGTAVSITNTYSSERDEVHDTPSPQNTSNPNGTPDPVDPNGTPDPGNPHDPGSTPAVGTGSNDPNDDDPNVPNLPINPNEEGNERTNDTDGGSNTSSTPSNGKLPQTGQLWWPVPIAAVLGLLLFIIGYGRARKAEENE